MRLKRSNLSGPGWHRRRRGRGFSYTDADGAPLTDPEVRERIDALAIPPAWKDVWICPHHNGHVQAVGTDSAGRRQYLYHEQWRVQRDLEKHDRVLALAPLLPGFREVVAHDLGTSGLTCGRVRAVALRLLDRGAFRVGSEEYAEDNGTHGVATLLREHVSVRRDTVELGYPAKGGIELSQQITGDALLAGAVRSLLRARSGSDRLLVHRTPGGWHEVTSDDVNERFKELVGSEFSVKDLRTWHATVVAAVAFARVDVPSSQRGLRRAEAEVMREVAEHLGNTPTVARKSYVDPRVVRLFEEGTTIRAALRRARGGDERQVAERAVVRMLREAG
jgi:DNA topoisomerase IB